MYTRNPDVKNPAPERENMRPPPDYGGSLWAQREEEPDAPVAPSAPDVPEEKEKPPEGAEKSAVGGIGWKFDPEDLLFFGAALFLLRSGEGDSWLYPAVLLLLILL